MRARHLIASLAAAGVLAGGAQRASAEVRVSGTENNIRVQTQGATMAEIIRGLETTLHTRIGLRGTPPQQFTGVYAGPLRRVLSRMLDGINYVINSETDGLTIVIVAPNGARPAPAYAAPAHAAPAYGAAKNGRPGRSGVIEKAESPGAAVPAPVARAASGTGDPWLGDEQGRPAPAATVTPAAAPPPPPAALAASGTGDPWLR